MRSSRTRKAALQLRLFQDGKTCESLKGYTHQTDSIDWLTAQQVSQSAHQIIAPSSGGRANPSMLFSRRSGAIERTWRML
jgi:hypothetical protein